MRRSFATMLKMSRTVSVLQRRNICVIAVLESNTELYSANRKTCVKYGKRHHTSICSKTKPQTDTQRKTDISDNRESEKSDASASVANMRSGIRSIKPAVLLKTAIAPISSHQRNFVDGNILLDDGAQRSFISEDFAGKLGISATKTEKIATTGFGDNGSSMRHL